MADVEFIVEGRPRPQGSKRPIPIKKNGRIVKTVMVEQSKHVGDWRSRVSYAAQQAADTPFGGPVVLHVLFVFARPKAHYRTGKNAHLLKPDAPDYPITRSTGDIDKLQRALLDALTGPVLVDDSQVVAVYAQRVYGSPERCEILVKECLPVAGEGAAAA